MRFKAEYGVLYGGSQDAIRDAITFRKRRGPGRQVLAVLVGDPSTDPMTDEMACVLVASSMGCKAGG